MQQILTGGVGSWKTTYVSEFERDLEVAGEMCCEVGIHFEYVEQIVSMNLVQVAVGKCSHVARRLADGLMYANVLAEYVIFT